MSEAAVAATPGVEERVSAPAAMDVIVVLDYGGQYSQLIARRVRESGVYCEIHPFDKVAAALLDAYAPAAVILSGGPASAGEAESPTPDPKLFQLGVPLLGACEVTTAVKVTVGPESDVPGEAVIVVLVVVATVTDALSKPVFPSGSVAAMLTT